MYPKFRIMLVLYMVFLFAGQPTSTGLQLNDVEGQDLFIPSRQEVETQLFASGSANDIWFQTTVDNALLTHGYTSSLSGFGLWSYDGRMRNSHGSYNALMDSAVANDVTRLYHASNFSAEPLDLTYETTYYDLTGGDEGLNELTGVLLFAEERSGFRFEAEAGEPLIISLKVKGNTETQDLSLIMVSPTGIVYDYSFVKNLYRTFVDEFIPIVPTETGLHTLYLTPNNPDTDIILQELRIYHSPSVFDIEGGHTAKWTGTETQTLFFRFDLDSGSSAPQVLDFNSEIFVNTSIPFVDQSFLLGSLEMNYFTVGTGPFGDGFPATVAQTSSNATYVAVTATPPNEANQFVAAKKAELGIKPGFDLDYAFWAEVFAVDEMELDVNVIIDDNNQPNSDVYYFNTTEDLIIGMNSTSVDGTIYSLDDPTLWFDIDGVNNDILFDEADDPILLPAGNYLAMFFGSQGDEFHIHTFEPLPLGSGSSTTVVLTLDQPLFYELPVPYPIKDYFNATLLDRELQNATFDLDFRLFDDEMTNVQTHSDTLTHYYNSGGANLVDNNNTEFGSTSYVQQYNLIKGYLRVELTDNELRDPLSGAVTVSSLANTTAKILLERLSYFNDLYNVVDGVFERQALTQAQASTKILNGSKAEYIYVWDYSTANVPTGYRFTIDTVNATFRILAFNGWTNAGTHAYEWFDFNKVSGPTTINGQTHYIHSLEFGTNEPLDFAFILYIASPVNGTLNILMEEFPVQETPGVSLQTLEKREYPFTTSLDQDEDGNFLDENGTIIVGAVAGVAIIGGVTYVIIRRRGA